MAASTAQDGPQLLVDAPQGSTTPADGPGRARRAVALTVALMPLLAAVVVWSFRHWTPTQDMALIDLRVRDVFGPDTPLVGAYSRYGWNHPGPFEFWTVALFGLPFGRPAWATLVGHVLLQIVPIVASFRWALRRSERAAIAVAALVTISYTAYGRWMIIEPWNPHVAYAWWIAMLVGTVLVCRGEHRLLPHLLVCATVLVQLHVGYLPIVVPLVALLVWWSRRDAAGGVEGGRGARRDWWRRVGVGVAVSAALSIPIVVDQLTASPGNLTAMWRFFTEGGLQTVGRREAAALMGEGFALPPQWAGRASVVDGFTTAVHARSAWWMLLAGALLAVGWVGAVWLPRWAARLMTVATVLLVVGVWSISRVTDAPSEYLFFWRTPIAALTWAVVAAVCFSTLRRSGRLTGWTGPLRLRRVSAVAPAVLVAAMALRALPLTVQVATSPPTVSRFEGIEEVTQRLIDETRARASRAGPIRVRAVGETMLGLQRSMVNGLDREGAEVRTGPGSAFQFGQRRTSLRGVEEVWYAVEGGPWVEALAEAPGATVLASNSPLAPEDEARLRELQGRIGAVLEASGRGALIGDLASPFAAVSIPAGGGIRRGDLDELASLNARLVGEPCRCAIVAFDVDEDPDLGPGTPLFGSR